MIIDNKYSNNEVVGESKREVGVCAVDFFGEGNKFIIGQGATLKNFRAVFRGKNGVIEVGANTQIVGQLIVGGDCKISIGEGTRFNKPCRIFADEGCSIKIGRDCLFANVRFRTSDSHSVIDLESGRRINPARNIVIEDHVWLAEDVYVYKGVVVGADSVVGARSTVTRSIPPNSVALGTPAKRVRAGVTWKVERVPTEFD
ncbi:hypothetical protein [Zavarzinia sp.]|uniref:hypothetical protein n=1 Tax=Zavarzinia sp. TaxID=2027920 RepID=UPI00356B090B